MRTLSLVIGMMVSLATPVSFAASFPDVKNHPHEAAIDILRTRGIMKGYPDGTFKPDRPVNRAELLKILMLSVYGNQAGTVKDRRCFKDFTGTEQWYWVTACMAKESGIVQGYPDGTFRGASIVITAEALKMAMKAWKMPLPVYIMEPAHWYDPYMDAAALLNVFANIPQSPSHNLTRGETAQMIVSLGVPLSFVTETTHPSAPASSSSSSPNPFPETFQQGALLIEQISTGTGDTTAGAAGISLLAFRATPARQDVILTGFKLRAESGDAASISHYRLYADANGDGSAETFVADGRLQGGTVFFSALTYPLKIGKSRRFDVRGDLSANATVGVAIGFLTSDAQYVTAKGAIDGKELSPSIETDQAGCLGPNICRITVHTRPGRMVTVSERGMLYVKQDASIITSKQLLLGEKTDVLALRLRATGENVLVTGLAIGAGGDNVSALELFLDGATQPFATARMVSCAQPTAGLFCAKAAEGLLTVMKDQDKRILVRAVGKTDVEGGVSGQTFIPTLSDSISSPAVTARGLATGKDLSQTDGDSDAEGEIIIGNDSPGANIAITGSTHDWVGAKILTIENASPDLDGAVVPVGSATFGIFRFRTAQNQNTKNGTDTVTLTKLVFTVTASNVQIASDGITLYHRANPLQAAACSSDQTTGTITITCQSLDASPIIPVIDASGTLELGLRGTVTSGIVVGSSTLQVSLNQLGTRSLPGTITWKDSNSTFQWVDLPVSQVKSTAYRTK